jgi:hypothetical protein
MKTKTPNTEKNEKPMFAFLPEMVLDHLTEAKSTEVSVENLNEPVIEKLTIYTDPEIPNLDDSIIKVIPKKKAKIKSIKTVGKVDKPVKKNTKKEVNFIEHFSNKIKNYLFQFLNQSLWKQTC